MNPTTHILGTTLRYIGFVAIIAALILATLATTAGAATTLTVAYVTDFGTGSNDATAPPATPGSSIFVNALTGVPPMGSYTTADGTKTVTMVDVSVAAIEANPGIELTGVDTIILYQVCDLASHPNTMTAINNVLRNGGKVLIFDADRCAASYSTFLFPFTAGRPAPAGSDGAYTNIQSSTLTAGLVLGPQLGEAVEAGADRSRSPPPGVEPGSCRPTREPRTAASSSTPAKTSGSPRARRRISARCSI